MPRYLAEPERTFRRAPLPEVDGLYKQLRSNASTGGEDIATFLSAAADAIRTARPKAPGRGPALEAVRSRCASEDATHGLPGAR